MCYVLNVYYIQVYEGHREWAGMFRWALKFCLESRNVFSGPYLTHINLVSSIYCTPPLHTHYCEVIGNIFLY